MPKWVIIAGIFAMFAAGAAIAILMGQGREDTRMEALEETLAGSAAVPPTGPVDFAALDGLPPPVVRYFRHVLTDGQERITSAELVQSGVLRTSIATDTWLLFGARHLAVPPATAFLWNARVLMPLSMHLRVLDSYIDGVAAGRVSMLSAFPVSYQSGDPELDSGALHRYLAEAVWFPTALLPEAGVEWTPIHEHAALATLSHGNTSVSLEFRFNRAGEVYEVYTPGRYGRFDEGYRQEPWQGHFRDYKQRDGMRVPAYGEVGWYVNGVLQIVWRGDIVEAEYEFGR